MRTRLILALSWLLLASGLTLAGIILLSVGQPDPIYGIAVGIAVALPALLTFIQELARSGTSARAKTVVVLGLLSFTTSFGLFAWMEAGAMRVSVEMNNLRVYPSVQNGETKVERQPGTDYLSPGTDQELWIRLMIPPSLRQPCYAAAPLVCSSADAALAAFGRSQSDLDWTVSLAGTSLTSLLTTSLLAWHFTRR